MWAFTRYSSDYVGQEKAAIDARLGVHAHDCMKAWDWRCHPRRTQDVPPIDLRQPTRRNANIGCGSNL
jgi:hypothetical protein